ncbi:MAG: ABC transporter ATP-binding protein [bacterium]
MKRVAPDNGTDPTSVTNLILHRLPDQVRDHTGKLGFTDGEVFFAVKSDLAFDGSAAEVWTIASSKRVVSVAVSASGVETVAGPFEFSAIQKARASQSVGCAFLQFKIDGLYVDVARYSNSHRELFGRVGRQIDRLVEGRPLPETALNRPSEMQCIKCGLPLPGRGTECPRCAGGHGIFARTLGLMRPYVLSILLLLGLMVAGVCLDLLPPLLQRTMVDDVLRPPEGTAPRPQQEALWALLLILLGIVAASGGRCLLNIFIGRMSSIIGTRITRELRDKLQAKLISLAVDYYNRHSVGSLMSRVLYDVDYFQGFVTQVAQGFLLNVMLVLGIGGMLFVMNWRLALLVLLPVPFVIIGTTFFWRHIYPRYYKVWDSQSKTAQLLSGLLAGIRLVKAFGQEQRERERFSKSAAYLQDSRRSLETSVATFNPIMGFVFGLGGLIIWYAGGSQVLKEHITLGTLMAFIGYLGMFYGPISALSMFSSWVTGFLSAGQRVFEVMDATVVVTENASAVRLPDMKGLIEFKNVTFGYDPYAPILKNVSFTIQPGQFVGIVGKSGSGKTTLVNLLCRFYDPQEGHILVDGVDVRDMNQQDLHRHMALVLQEPFLFRASIAENIAYGRPEASRLAIMNAARAANAHDFIAKRPSAYDTKLGEHGAGLSGGERQRVSIARALLCDPKVLILDEATSSVDTESEQAIQKALASLCRGRTTIAIAHRLSTLKNADHIYVMEDGKIIESGTHEELLTLKGVYHKLVMIQTELTRLEV